jgi:REP element-mobilizing transposase RayT
MPDHAHVLLHGTSPSSVLLRFVQRFKQLTGFHYKQQEGWQLWQQSFFDRLLRRDEDRRAVASYIFSNPVEAGIVDSARDYQYLGGAFWPTADRDGAEAASLLSIESDATEPGVLNG